MNALPLAVAAPGERFDVEVACDQPTGNYWLHAESLVDDDVYRHHDGLAILRYTARVRTCGYTAGWVCTGTGNTARVRTWQPAL